jgi:hypothetical protein
MVQALWHSGSGARQAVAIQISHGQSHLLSAGSSSWKNIDIAQAHGAQAGDRAKKLFQFLNEIGARGLRMHLGRVLEMAESSPGKAAYEQKINERFGMEQQRDLPIPTPLPAPTEAAN